MGKTLPPFSQLIEYERRRWAPFKRALPKADQPFFDRLFDCAKLHIQAGVMVARPLTFETIVMAIVLEQQKRFCRKVRFWGKIRKSCINNSMTYRSPNARKSNFATEPWGFLGSPPALRGSGVGARRVRKSWARGHRAQPPECGAGVMISRGLDPASSVPWVAPAPL